MAGDQKSWLCRSKDCFNTRLVANFPLQVAAPLSPPEGFATTSNSGLFLARLATSLGHRHGPRILVAVNHIPVADTALGQIETPV